jgi:hypothetical protein
VAVLILLFASTPAAKPAPMFTVTYLSGSIKVQTACGSVARVPGAAAVTFTPDVAGGKSRLIRTGAIKTITAC